ncbi:MAG: DUF1211 domain-containing protein [Thermoleophilaceae bacterium]|nr:DUF1211 domain-containing protein [Thermoleophilaceae bacterium]
MEASGPGLIGARDLSRIAAFTDGVMAVAITLLVLNMEVPRLQEGQSLGDALVDLLPSLGAYLLSFALVGRFWVIHHNLFEKLRAFDRTLMTLNLAFLALIVLVPFAADLYDAYTDEPLAAAVLGGTLGLAAIVNWTRRTGSRPSRSPARSAWASRRRSWCPCRRPS